MSLESPTILRQNLLSVIQTTPEADLPQLLALVRDFQQRTIDRNPAQIRNYSQAVEALLDGNVTRTMAIADRYMLT